jgi:hypothetical protein
MPNLLLLTAGTIILLSAVAMLTLRAEATMSTTPASTEIASKLLRTLALRVPGHLAPSRLQRQRPGEAARNLYGASAERRVRDFEP